MTKKKDIEAIPMSFDLERKTRLGTHTGFSTVPRTVEIGTVFRAPFSNLVITEKPTHPKGVNRFFGAEDEARTRYLHLGKVALYQMSYSRTTEIIIATVKPSLGKN